METCILNNCNTTGVIVLKSREFEKVKRRTKIKENIESYDICEKHYNSFIVKYEFFQRNSKRKFCSDPFKTHTKKELRLN